MQAGGAHSANWRGFGYQNPSPSCPVSTVETLRKCLSLHLLAAMFMHLWTAANKGVTIYKSPWTSNTRSTIARASLPWTLPPLAAHAKA